SSPEGERILRALVVEDPDDDVTRRALVGELLRERRYPDAKTLLDDAIRRAGDDPHKIPAKDAANVELGYLAVLQKDYARGMQILAPLAVKQGTVNARAVRVQASAAREKEDFASGLQIARAAAAANRSSGSGRGSKEPARRPRPRRSSRSCSPEDRTIRRPRTISVTCGRTKVPGSKRRGSSWKRRWRANHATARTSTRSAGSTS